MSVNHAKVQHVSYPWGQDLVSEVEVACRCKVPAIPQLTRELELFPIPAPEFEYDFIRERQAVADFDDYLASKLRSCQSWVQPTSSPTSVQSVAVNQARSSEPSVVVVEPSYPEAVDRLTCGAKVANPPRCRSPQQTVVTSSANSAIPSPPLAASQLVTDRVLQPEKQSNPQSWGAAPANSATSAKLILAEPAAQLKSTRNSYAHRQALLGPKQSTDPQNEQTKQATAVLRDFDASQDDPFLAVELKTINEYEELRKVLLDSTVHNVSPASQQQFLNSGPNTKRFEGTQPASANSTNRSSRSSLIPSHIVPPKSTTGSSTTCGQPMTPNQPANVKEICFPQLVAEKEQSKLVQNALVQVQPVSKPQNIGTPGLEHASSLAD